MSRSLHRLTDTYAKSSNLKPGRHADGGGLYLNVKESGSKSWIFLFKRGGVRKAVGLGAYPAITLATARKNAAECRSAVAIGNDPAEINKSAAEVTFDECAHLFLTSMEVQWRNPKHRAQWRSTLGPAYCAQIQDKNVSSISTDQVLAVLTPIWSTKPETASRIRGRIERVLDFAKARGWRTGENPALWRGHLKNILPVRQKLSRGHHAAMPYVDVPAFLADLRKRDATAARALEFVILCAGRSGEVLGALWEEVNFKERVWTIPPTRMKAGRLHRVPLSEDAITLLRTQFEVRQSDFIFPGQRPGRPLSPTAMEMQLRRMKQDEFTTHGFRSSFRDWAGEETLFPREVAEAALAHVVGDATERAYRRGDALKKRHELMEAWARYCGCIQNSRDLPDTPQLTAVAS